MLTNQQFLKRELSFDFYLDFMKNALIIFALVIVSSCSPTKQISYSKCPSMDENYYENILEDKFKTVIKNDTIQLNVIKFLCVRTAFYLDKGMFDKFGKWHQTIHPDGKTPFLLWQRVKLFSNDTTKFTVATRGYEGLETIYTSVLVFDENNKDLLADNSEYKSKLIEYFSNMIHTNDKRKKDFYEHYWKEIDPARWEELEKYRKLGLPTY